MQLRYARPVTYAIGGDYKYTVWHDVLRMDSGDVLLRRPGMYDNRTHGMRDNTYIFAHMENM